MDCGNAENAWSNFLFANAVKHMDVRERPLPAGTHNYRRKQSKSPLVPP